MQELTKQTIQRIQAKTNHAVIAPDFDDIEELDKLAEKVAGVSKRERRLLNQPFELCGIKFYPLTVAKSLWFTEKVEEWDIEGAHQEGLLFWLLTLPLTEAALDTYDADPEPLPWYVRLLTRRRYAKDTATAYKRADRAAKKLTRRLHCSAEEMSDIYRKCVGVGDGKKGDGSPADYGGTIACLIKEYGGTPDQWLYETPVEKLAALFDQYEKRIIAEDNASRTKTPAGSKAVAPKVTAGIRAIGEFQTKAREIEAKWSANDES